MRSQVGKFLHDAEATRHLDLADDFVARLLVIPPRPRLPGGRDGTQAIDNAVVAIYIAVKAAHLAVRDDVDPRPFLIQNGDIGGVVEQLLQVVRPPFSRLIRGFALMPPAWMPV